jgi:Tfp pilus assembly PilM family ATPase
VAGGLSGWARSVSSAIASVGRRVVIGLSVEGNDLRLICISGREIVRFLSRPLPDGAMPGGVVADASVFGKAVRSILHEYELPRATIVAGFSDAEAITKMLTLPAEAGGKLAELVQQEAQNDPVIRSGDYRVYHYVVARTASQTNAFMLAVRGAALDEYVAGLQQAGIAPHMVDLRALAMIRAINQPHTIIAGIERTALDVIIVSNYAPVIMRSVPLSGTEADIDLIGREIEQTIEAYNRDHPHPLSPRLPLALIGEMADDPAVQQAIMARVQHPFADLACPYSAPSGFAIANFAVSIGLALKAR